MDCILYLALYPMDCLLDLPFTDTEDLPWLETIPPLNENYSGKARKTFLLAAVSSLKGVFPKNEKGYKLILN